MTPLGTAYAERRQLRRELDTMLTALREISKRGETWQAEEYGATAGNIAQRLILLGRRIDAIRIEQRRQRIAAHERRGAGG